MAKTDTAASIEQFPKIVKERSAKNVGDAQDILDKLLAVKNTAPPMFYDDSSLKVYLSKRADAIATLASNYVVARLSQKYPLLDKTIFNLKRYISVKDGVIVRDSTLSKTPRHGSGVAQVQVPLFAHSAPDAKEVNCGSYTKLGKPESWGYRRRTTVKITAKVPEVPIDIQLATRKAFAYVHALLADVLNNDALLGVKCGVTSPQHEVMWIPATESLTVKVDTTKVPVPRKYDPAIIMNVGEYSYVVGMWEIKDEKPFESILREFTVGPAKFPKKETPAAE